MNQSQRNFLVEKIEESTKKRIADLKESIPKCPSLENHLTHAIMSGTFEIKPTEEIKRCIHNKVMGLRKGDYFLESHWLSHGDADMKFRPSDIFIIPKEYQEKFDEYEAKKKSVEDAIEKIRSEKEALVMRVKLSSNHILEKLIMEVDDMGEVGLLDTKIKEISAKQLT